MTTIAQTKTPFERFITRLVVQVKEGATFAPQELHRLMVAFASTEGVRFTRDEVDGVLTTFSSHDHEGAPATVTFATATGAQPRDDQGRYRETQRPYRGEDMTPEYRQQLLNYSPLGRQILKADGQTRSLTYEQLWRQIVEGEAATRAGR